MSFECPLESFESCSWRDVARSTQIVNGDGDDVTDPEDSTTFPSTGARDLFSERFKSDEAPTMRPS